MDHNFVSNANITRFAGLLVTEADMGRRYQLKALLIEEENKLGRWTEKLDQILRRISECNARIANLETILERSKANGYEVGPTEQVLRNMRELNRIYDDYRQTIVDGLDRSPLR